MALPGRRRGAEGQRALTVTGGSSRRPLSNPPGGVVGTKQGRGLWVGSRKAKGIVYPRGSVYNARLFGGPREERISMRIRFAILFATAFVFIVFGAAAGGGGEEKSQPQKEEVKEEEIKEEKVKEQTKAPEEEQKKEEEGAPEVKGPVKGFEDLPEEVKAKLPEEAKQEIKQGPPKEEEK